jgi:hypothetical protein
MKINKTLIYILLITIVICFSACNDEVNIYVSPQGNDANPGTKELPLASLNGAKNYVRKVKSSTSGDIAVWFRGGDYYLDETVVFGLKDSGSEESTITYQAYPDEKPVFTSDINIKGWKKIDIANSALPKAATGKIWVADVPKKKSASWHFYTLYDSKGRLPRARSKGFIPSTVSTEVLLDSTDRDILRFPSGVLKNWSNLEDVEIVVRPYQGWVMNILPLESVDEKSNIATTVFTATYLMDELHLIRGRESAWVENVLEALDEPGEWVLNSKEGKLYLWSRDGAKPQGIKAPLLKEYILVKGEEDTTGNADIPVRNLNFKGLTLMHGERYSYTEEDKGLQHDWEMYDNANALIRFRTAKNCIVEQCHFVHSGGTAIRSDLYGQRITIKDNHIEHIGGTGVLLCGYGPGEKDVNKKNLIYNNHIHDCGEIYWHSPAVFVWQSGENRIANNLIHNTPYSGIIISGLLDRFKSRSEYKKMDLSNPYENSIEADESLHFSYDNLIEYNEIHHVVELLGDGNGIYLRGAGTGNVISHNYIHHMLQSIVMQSPIRTDGLQKGTSIIGNLLYKCVSHGIHLKYNNHAVNNILVDMIAPVHKGITRLPSYFKLRSGPLTGGAIQRNILYHTKGNVDFYDQGIVGNHVPAWAKEADTDYNLYYCAENPLLSQQTLETAQKEGIDMYSLATDPLFVDPEKGDFRLKPESPALKLGFVPIDLSKVGLRDIP